MTWYHPWRRRTELTIGLLCGLWSGCASTTPAPAAPLAHQQPPQQDAATTTGQSVPTKPLPQQATDKAEAHAQPVGAQQTHAGALVGDGPAITRGQLDTVLARGPQAFIRSLRVRPSFRRGRFYGWRVLRYSGPGPLEREDVVRSVNGHSLERPDEFMNAWESLKGTAQLEVRLVRKGRPVTLRYAVVD